MISRRQDTVNLHISNNYFRSNKPEGAFKDLVMNSEKQNKYAHWFESMHSLKKKIKRTILTEKPYLVREKIVNTKSKKAKYY